MLSRVGLELAKAKVESLSTADGDVGAGSDIQGFEGGGADVGVVTGTVASDLPFRKASYRS